MVSERTATSERFFAVVGRIALVGMAVAGVTRLLAGAGAAVEESMDGVFDDALDGA